ncbi:MAG TPA: lasso peptide biosynthesis B2 protein [Bacteroidales bacterium]|nr:lasso peptide biosynthesis B2 protein [Bacteroidales bacterium]
MFYLLTKYLKTTPLEKRLLRQTFFWLVVSFVWVRWFPLRWFSHRLGAFRKESEDALQEGQEELTGKAQHALRRLKRRLPWSVKCFEEAIAVKKVLRFYGIESTLYLGVKKDEEKNLKAHAWLKAGGRVVAGEKGYKEFTVVGFYR